jgi:hypothetical protein
MAVEEITKIPTEELAKVVEEFTLLKAKIEVRQDPDGTFSVRATLPDSAQEQQAGG